MSFEIFMHEKFTRLGYPRDRRKNTQTHNIAMFRHISWEFFWLICTSILIKESLESSKLIDPILERFIKAVQNQMKTETSDFSEIHKFSIQFFVCSFVRSNEVPHQFENRNKFEKYKIKNKTKKTNLLNTKITRSWHCGKKIKHTVSKISNDAR